MLPVVWLGILFVAGLFAYSAAQHILWDVGLNRRTAIVIVILLLLLLCLFVLNFPMAANPPPNPLPASSQADR